MVLVLKDVIVQRMRKAHIRKKIHNSQYKTICYSSIFFSTYYVSSPRGQTRCSKSPAKEVMNCLLEMKSLHGIDNTEQSLSNFKAS